MNSGAPDHRKLIRWATRTPPTNEPMCSRTQKTNTMSNTDPHQQINPGALNVCITLNVEIFWCMLTNNKTVHILRIGIISMLFTSIDVVQYIIMWYLYSIYDIFRWWTHRSFIFWKNSSQLLVDFLYNYSSYLQWKLCCILYRRKKSILDKELGSTDFTGHL